MNNSLQTFFNFFILLLFVVPVHAQKPELVLPIGHTKVLNSAEFSPDGKRIVTASRDKTAKIWDAETGKLLHSLEGHSELLWSAEFSPDGKRVVTASQDYTAKIWDTETGKLLHSLEGHKRDVKSAEFSFDGKRVLTASDDKTAKIWDTETGKLLRSLEKHARDVKSAEFSPDGKRVVTASDDTAKIWDTETGELLQTLKEHTDWLYSAVFSPDGKRVVTASRDYTAKIWDSKTGEVLHSLEGHTEYINSAEFSPDGKRVLTASDDKTAKIWDTETGKLLKTLEGHAWYVNSAEFSPDGKRVLTVPYKDKTAKIWDTQTGKLLQTLKGHTDWVYSAEFSPDSKGVLTASRDYTAKIWDTETGKLLQTMEGHTWYVNSAEFSPDGKRVIIASDDKTAKIWDTETGKLLQTLKGHTDWVYSAVFSPDGKRVITASDDKTAKIWDTETGKLLQTMEGHSEGGLSAEFNPDGKRVATAEDVTDKRRDTEAGKLLQTLKGHSEGELSAEFSPDGKRVVTAGDVTVKIWDAFSGDLLKTIITNGPVINFSFKEDLLMSYFNSLLTLYKLSTGEELLSFVSTGSNDWAVIHPSGLFDASTGAMEKLYFVQGLDIIEFGQLKNRYWEPGLWKKIMTGEKLRDVADFDKELKLFPDIEKVELAENNLKFNLKNKGGGIGRVQIFINGKEIAPDARSKGFNENSDSVSLSYSLANHPYLKPGENEIEIRAWDSEEWLVSRGAKIIYTVDDKEVEKPNLFLIAVGVSDYTGEDIDLKYAAKDAEDISHALELGAQNLFGADNTFTYLLTTNKDINSYPSKENIIKAFEDAGKKAKSTDVLVVYLSGHGINLGGLNGDFYYLTQDAYTASSDAYNDPAIIKSTTLSSKELVELIKKVPANKQVLIIDACASGKTVKNLMDKRDISSTTIRALDRMKDRMGLHIITGSTADAVSYEASKFGQGLLTYSLLEGIKGAALREDKFIDIHKLFQRSRERVPVLAEGIGGIQTPQLFSPYGAESFDIGWLTEDDKTKIQLAKEKPIFIYSNFQEEKSFDDILGIEQLVDDQFREITAKGSDATVIFYETKKFPGAYRLRGQYRQVGDEIILQLNIFKGKKKQESLTINGNKNNLPEFVRNIIDSVQSEITN